MNEENALSQLKLTQTNSQARKMQLMALNVAVNDFDPTGATLEVRTSAKVAVFLTYLAKRAEYLLSEELRIAFQAIEHMKQLPDEAQWEYRSAHSLGVAEGLNRIAAVQAKIIEQAQNSLHKAAIFLMAANAAGLPAAITHAGAADKFNSPEDYIRSNMLELSDKAQSRLKNANKLALDLSRAYLKRTLKGGENAELSISSVCLNALEATEANILAAYSAFALEAVEHGEFLDDPARGALDPEFGAARLIAAGIVSVMVTDSMKRNAAWISLNLN